MEQEIARLLLTERAVMLNAKQPYTYASGIRSPIYCDNRVLISSPAARKRIVKAFQELITAEHLSFDIIAGTATAGIPWAAWLADALELPLVYVRAKAKEHGKQNAIEGKITENARVLVIEDLISTGGSSYAAVEALRDAGTTVVACLAIFTYEMESAIAQFKNCPLYTLTKFSVLITEAKKEHYLSAEEAEQVLSWNKDPEHWAKRAGL